MKGGIFTGPQIWQMLGSKELEDKMTALERDAWQSFCNVVHGLLGRNKADRYEDFVETLLQIYCNLGSTENALPAFSLGFFQAKFERCEQRAR